MAGAPPPSSLPATVLIDVSSSTAHSSEGSSAPQTEAGGHFNDVDQCLRMAACLPVCAQRLYMQTKGREQMWISLTVHIASVGGDGLPICL